MKKPKWVVEKEQSKRAAAQATVWLFGLHAVRDALSNPARAKLRLVVTKNAASRLAEAIAAAGIVPEIADPRRFPVPLDPGSVHQGVALEVRALDWGPFEEVCAGGAARPATEAGPGGATDGEGRTTVAPAARALVVCLDRVTDPHNVGAILRSAEVFGARAVIAPSRHSAPETGALAKSASGALERQPYLRIGNLADALERLRAMGFTLIGLDGEGPLTLEAALAETAGRPVGLVLGAEGPGLRSRTRETCDLLARIDGGGGFGSLNVSNAAAVALHAARRSTP